MNTKSDSETSIPLAERFHEARRALNAAMLQLAAGRLDASSAAPTFDAVQAQLDRLASTLDAIEEAIQ